MEKFSSQEQYSMFEVKLCSGITPEDIKNKLNKERFVQFSVTKDSDIFISDQGHDDIMRRTGVFSKDITHRGYFWIINNNLSIFYYDKIHRDNKKQIDEAINSFVIGNIK